MKIIRNFSNQEENSINSIYDMIFTKDKKKFITHRRFNGGGFMVSRYDVWDIRSAKLLKSVNVNDEFNEYILKKSMKIFDDNQLMHMTKWGTNY